MKGYSFPRFAATISSHSLGAVLICRSQVVDSETLHANSITNWKLFHLSLIRLLMWPLMPLYWLFVLALSAEIQHWTELDGVQSHHLAAAFIEHGIDSATFIAPTHEYWLHFSLSLETLFSCWLTVFCLFFLGHVLSVYYSLVGTHQEHPH